MYIIAIPAKLVKNQVAHTLTHCYLLSVTQALSSNTASFLSTKKLVPIHQDPWDTYSVIVHEFEYTCYDKKTF